MGDPRRLKKKYNTPMHPWQRARLGVEAELVKEYGLKNKQELWKMNTILKGFADQAKTLIARVGPQAQKEKEQLFSRLERLGILSGSSALDDVLSLTIHDVLKRRLQTLVHKKGLARTVDQSRQFITHQHICVNDKVVASPGYLVKSKDEPSVMFVERSSLKKEDHPERVQKSAGVPGVSQTAQTVSEEKDDAPRAEKSEGKNEHEHKAQENKTQKPRAKNKAGQTV